MSKAMVLVHGMGEHKRNAPLMGAVRPILEVIRARGRPPLVKTIRIEGDSTNGKPSATEITYGDQTWRLLEYWWAE